ncbi:MAG: hypothetical protein IPL47_12375 [Phyllobacteriaceae bacterium]|nr:hypothetical protein [Phyllobacteriaceae bacterium]
MRVAALFLLLFPLLATPALAGGQAPPSVAAPKPETPTKPESPAETTEWMNIVDAEERAREFRKAGRAMTAIECRANLNLDVDAGDSAEFRFRSVVNDSGINWTWREFPAPELKAKDRELANEGFARVTTCEFERHPSGQKRICALWHK